MYMHYITFSQSEAHTGALCTIAGRSLVWVGILGLVVFYLYAIVSFAMMRSMFNPCDYMYCDNLWQCTITVIRYGLIGDLFEVGTLFS
ncbi:hypothetical protein DPMN_126235 [Dreissena polymorpha]|uniref:Uncharacterized protein n=1 Tax=Dreissena polymorpha TaxID=45954 RepID=A0A9D4GZR8_DREPO|nr:hypothetical protein DPMN_126235 [Dreissena polymorpha]